MISGGVLCGAVVLAVAGWVDAVLPQVPASPGTGAVVATFVRTALAPQVLLLEAALATANRQVLAYCRPPEMVLVRCTDFSGHLGGGTLGGILTAQALALRSASQNLEALLPPDVGRQPTLHLRCVEETLALFSDQLTGLLQESAAALSSTTLQQATDAQPAPRLSYGPRLRAAVSIVRRAEAWLVAVDCATGAHATLPGFARGVPPIETQRGLP
jgi:hypothetical protein